MSSPKIVILKMGLVPPQKAWCDLGKYSTVVYQLPKRKLESDPKFVIGFNPIYRASSTAEGLVQLLGAWAALIVLESGLSIHFWRRTAVVWSRKTVAT